MKRTIVAAMALAFATVAFAPAFADTPDLRSSKGVHKFWQEQEDQRGG